MGLGFAKAGIEILATLRNENNEDNTEIRLISHSKGQETEASSRHISKR
jgi:hypothetical protein